jgi:hypothetical protein
MTTKINQSNITPTGVTAGTYTTANITVNNKGQITAASSGVAIGGGLLVNKNSIDENYTLASGYNAFSVGPLTVANGVTVTIPAGQRWVVV